MIEMIGVVKMTEKIYTNSISKKDVKSFFEDGIWSKDDITCILVQGRYDLTKKYQIFGAKGMYGMPGDQVTMINATSGRQMNCIFEIVDVMNGDEIEFVKGFAARVMD